jgi:hypothetical protein
MPMLKAHMEDVDALDGLLCTVTKKLSVCHPYSLYADLLAHVCLNTAVLFFAIYFLGHVLLRVHSARGT